MSNSPGVQRSLLLTSSVEVSPARTSVQLAQAAASKVLEAVFGTSSRESLRSSVPRGWSSRMSVERLIDGWMPSDSTWESATMLAYRSRLQQKMQALRTDAFGSSSWPTVVVTDEASSGRATTLADPKNSMKPGTSLTDAMRAWPTPTASEYGTSGNGCPGDGREEYAHKGTPSLQTLARKGWATPTKRDEKGPMPNKRQGGRDLATDVSQWSTPKATDDKRGASPNRVNSSGGDRNLPTDIVTFPQGPTTQKDGESGSKQAVLNPEFVRTLMGFPEGWLDVE